MIRTRAVLPMRRSRVTLVRATEIIWLAAREGEHEEVRGKVEEALGGRTTWPSSCLPWPCDVAARNDFKNSCVRRKPEARRPSKILALMGTLSSVPSLAWVVRFSRFFLPLHPPSEVALRVLCAAQERERREWAARDYCDGAMGPVYLVIFRFVPPHSSCSSPCADVCALLFTYVFYSGSVTPCSSLGCKWRERLLCSPRLARPPQLRALLDRRRRRQLASTNTTQVYRPGCASRHSRIIRRRMWLGKRQMCSSASPVIGLVDLVASQLPPLRRRRPLPPRLNLSGTLEAVAFTAPPGWQ